MKNKHRSWAEPYKIKMVEPLRILSKTERRNAIAEAGFNTFLLHSRDVYIDLLTDSGTSAMSDRQWAGIMLGDESYAGSVNYYHFEETVQRRYGFEHVVPTHQGRGAEHLLSRMFIKSGDFVPGNMYFTTTKAHQELAGGSHVDVIIDEAHDPTSEFPFKGNIDLVKLRSLVDRVGIERIAYLNVQTNVNMAGGQPISLANLHEVRRYCQSIGLLMFLDATRAAENAYFIKEREPGQSERLIADILLEICSCTDGCICSAKKDALVNIGGWIAFNDDDHAEQARNLVVLFEGLHTYGGLAGRDLEAMAIGIEESLEYDHLHARIGQVEYLGEALIEAGIPVVLPIGGHGVFLDAARFLPHLPRDKFPAQALAAALYVESGVRSMERGGVSAGRDPATGKNILPALELVRLAIPRRVYTQAHMDVTAEGVINLYQHRQDVVGLRITHEPKQLRFFQSRFEPVVGSQIMVESAMRAPVSAAGAESVNAVGVDYGRVDGEARRGEVMGVFL